MPEKRARPIEELHTAAQRREELARAYARRAAKYRREGKEMRQVADEIAARVERGTAGAREKP